MVTPFQVVVVRYPDSMPVSPGVVLATEYSEEPCGSPQCTKSVTKFTPLRRKLHLNSAGIRPGIVPGCLLFEHQRPSKHNIQGDALSVDDPFAGDEMG